MSKSVDASLWRGISNLEEIEEIKAPFQAKKRPDYVFCEDLSRFLPVAATREFVADLPSNFVRRFVLAPGSPQAKGFAASIKGVDYEPRVRLSL